MIEENGGFSPSAEELLRGLEQTDPEFYGLFYSFAFDEVPAARPMPHRVHHLAVLAALIGCQGVEAFGREAAAALRGGLTAVEIREVLYQSVAYLGLGRVLPFFGEANAQLQRAGIALPLAPQRTVEYGERAERGEEAQVNIFGEGMRGFSRRGGKTEHINRWLSANCFGDYYTRGGLSYADRELITFCFLAAQGGCEPQLMSHAAANLRIGNGEQLLISVISHCLPYIGYPRTLNALRCVEEAAKNQK